MSGDAREARKFGTDAPGRPTDEFVIHAFAEGARWLWPDSRDPGWHVTFRRWLTARDAAIRAEALANVPICSWHQNAYPDICWWCEASRNQNALRRAAQPTEGES